MPFRGTLPALLVLAGTLATAPAVAQTDAPADAADAAPLPAAFSLADALSFDPAALSKAPPKPLHHPSLYDKTGLDISRDDKPDGSSTVTLKKALPIDWETKVGADIAAAPPSTFGRGQPLPGGVNACNSGAAWASLGVPNLASIDARLDPNIDQSTLGTTLRHAMPIGGKLSLTLQETLSVTDTFNARRPANPAPRAGRRRDRSSQFWGSENRLKFDILPTRTSLAAGIVTSSIDPVTHNTFSADQKLYGPLHLTTALNDIGQPSANKSITASVKLNW